MQAQSMISLNKQSLEEAFRFKDVNKDEIKASSYLEFVV